jgi:hypothetical protein
VVSFDLYAKALAALVSAAFALIVLAGGPRRPLNAFLGAFLLLIAGNQGAEVLRGLALGTPGEALWLRVGVVFGALDPLFLYYAASLYPRRNALNAPLRVAWVAAAALLLALAGPFLASRGGVPPPLELALAAFTCAVYGAVLLHAFRHLRAAGGAPAVLLFAGACVAAIPVWARVVRAAGNTAGFLEGGQIPDVWRVAAFLAPLLALGLVAWAVRGAPRPLRRAALAGAAVGTVLSIAVDALVVVEALGLGGAGAGPLFLGLTVAAISLRWVLFNGLLSMAVLRHEMLGMTLAARRRGARAVVAVGFLAAALLALAAVQALAGSPPGLSLVELVVLAIVVGASQAFRAAVDRVAQRVYGVPMPGDQAAALEVYRRAATRALEEGRPPAEEPGLARLRDELGIDRRMAGILERMAQGSSPGPLVPGQLAGGRYRVDRLLARGGAGRVFLARDELLERAVVLKEVLQAGDATAGAALREARLAGALQHPNVVAVLDAVQRPESALLVLEYLPRGSLADRLEEGPLQPGEAWRVGDGMLAALEAVHAKGIVHRDLKPENILLAADGTPKLADFGLARVDRGVTQAAGAPRAVEGTPAYMAPEQRRGEPASAASDLYAAGLVLRRCFPGADGPLARVLDRATAEEPGERWPSASAMREALRSAAPGAGRVPPP